MMSRSCITDGAVNEDKNRFHHYRPLIGYIECFIGLRYQLLRLTKQGNDLNIFII